MSGIEDVTKFIRDVLPNASPKPRDRHEAIALCLHCTARAAGFKHTDTSGQPCSDSPVAEDWNLEPEVSVFRYANANGKEMVVKVLKMGDSALAHIQSGNDESDVITVEFNVDDFVNPNVPYADYNKLYTLGLSEMISRFQKAAGVSQTTSTSSTDYSSATSDKQKSSSGQPQRQHQPDPFSPRSDDPLRDPRFRPGYPMPGGIGRGDLDPLGGAGGVFIGDPRGGHAGMLMDPRGLMGPHGVHPGTGGGLGPRGIVPGARFDPIFPGGGPMGGDVPFKIRSFDFANQIAAVYKSTSDGPPDWDNDSMFG